MLAAATPPLFDYPNHLARMHIIAHLADHPALQRFYALVWRPVPNLAMDLAVPPLARIIPLAWAGKAFILATFLLIAGGTAALHRVLFARWSAWPCLAFLLLYNRILLWGFLNFLFGVGLALAALALWIALGRRPLRLPIAALLALALYLAHLFALGAYAVLLGGYEIGRLWREGRLTSRAGLGELAASAAQFLLPAVLLWTSTAASGGAGPLLYSHVARKFDLFFNILDNYDRPFDIATFVLLGGLFLAGAARRKIAFSRAMVLPLLLLLATQLAMPNRAFGGTGVDHRMPIVLALVLVAASRPVRLPAALGAGLALLFLVRLVIVAAHWQAADRAYAPLVAALGALPEGTRLAVALPPDSVHIGTFPPITHLASLAVIAADAFVPTLFHSAGQQPLRFRPRYQALADAASPEAIWQVLVARTPDSGGRVAAALAGYDDIVVFGSRQAPGDPRLRLRAQLPDLAAGLYALEAPGAARGPAKH